MEKYDHKAKKIFISYSHQNKDFVQNLVDQLEKDGNIVWWDFESIQGGLIWQKEIEKAIKFCQYFIVVLTPNSVNSDWVMNEITYALQEEKQIIPLYLQECEIPLSIIQIQYIDFVQSSQREALQELYNLLKLESKGIFQTRK